MVRRLAPRAPTGAAGALRDARLVGRHDELAALLAAVEDPPCIVVVEGEAGVGKTRLIAEMLDHPQMRTRRRLVGHFHPAHEPFPLGAVVEALRTLEGALGGSTLNPVAGALRPLLPELAGDLPPALDDLGDPLAERHRVFRAVLETLTALGPTVLVLEDLHWADQPTLELLRFMATHPPPQCAVVLTVRREELGPAAALDLGTGSFHTIGLQPFGADEVRALMAQLLAEEPPHDVAQLVLDKTSGIPFAVEEVTRLLHHAAVTDPGAEGLTTESLTRLGVPSGVRESVLQRRAQLSQPTQQLLDAAAVVETPASDDVLYAVADLPSDEGLVALAGAVSGGMLHETSPGRYVFRHVLGREAVYEAIVGPRRSVLHAAAADALHSHGHGEDVDRLAHHSKRAQRLADWVQYAEASADLAGSLGNDLRAAEILTELAAHEAVHAGQRARILTKLAESSWRSHRPSPSAVEVIRAFLDTGAADHETLGRLRFLLGRILLQAEDVDAGRRELISSLGYLDANPGLAARAMAGIAMAGHLRARAAEDIEWLERATAMAQRQDDPYVKLVVLVDRVNVLLGLGDPAGWELLGQLPTDVATAAERVQVIRGHANIASMAASLGHYGRARDHLRLAEQMSAGRYEGPGLAFMESTALILDWETGRWSACDALVARYLSARRLTVERPTRVVHRIEALLRFVRGEAGSEELAARLPEERSVRDHEGVARTAAVLIRDALARDDVAAAAGIAAEAWEILADDSTGIHATEFVVPAATALARSGDAATAGDLVSRIAAATQSRDAPAAHAATDAALGVLELAAGRWAAASELLDRAEDAARALPQPYVAAQWRELRGDAVLTQEGDADLLERALREYQDLGAAWDAARVRRTLRRHGFDDGRRRGRRSYPTTLSPREQQVAALAAEGLTDREIAQRLFLSTRTVEGHLARALGKLKVASRRDLPAALPPHGEDRHP